MSDNKHKLLSVLNNCVYNKTIEDYNYIVAVATKVNNYTGDIRIFTDNDNTVYTYLNNRNTNVTIAFFTDNTIVMQKGILKSFSIRKIANDSYNVQYDNIKQLLINQ